MTRSMSIKTTTVRLSTLDTAPKPEDTNLQILQVDVDGAAAQYDQPVEIIVGAASRLSSATLTGDTKSSNWIAGNTNRDTGRGSCLQESERPGFGVRISTLGRVAALKSTSVARVESLSATGLGEGDGENGHEGSNKESEDREHG